MTRVGGTNPPTAARLVGPASRLPAHERGAFLDRECAGDAALRREVEELLGYLDPRFMEQGPVAGPLISPELVPDPSDVLPEGTRIGMYTVRRVLGQGGMGVVYLAEQENPRRDVALKVVRAGIASPSVLRRFQREAGLMGRLQHPGIVQIFEAGEAEVGRGRQPYLAMEYVPGPTLNTYVQGRSVRERLEVVAKVCDAVEHAHDRGLIHRDLKPGNILVSESGQPKVLDFGVAREPIGATTTLATSVGQLIGTLAYMSPEQAGADPSRVDARSDVYSIGVILYEALTGRLPVRVRPDAVAESVRAIREDEPARPGSINRVLRGDIETITLKALEKDPDRRYQTARHLAADIRRYLAGEPIVARQDSALYVLQKKLRRYRWAVGAGAAFIAVVSAFAVYSIVQAQAMKVLAGREREAKNEAQNAADRATAAEAARREELRLSNLERGRLLSRSGDAGEGEALLWRAHLQKPDSALSHWALREYYAGVPCLSSFRAGPQVVRTLALSDDAKALVITGWDGSTEVWDLEMSVRRHAFAGPPASQRGVLIPSGLMVTGSRPGAVTIWDVREASVRGELAEAGADTVIAVSRDGLLGASGNAAGELILWDLPAQRRVRSIATGHTGGITAVALSPDGRAVATGGRDRAARLWDVDTGERRGESKGLSGWVTSLMFSSDGGRLACGSSNWKASVWDLRTGAARTFADDQGVVPFVAYVKGESLIAAMGEYGISLYDASTLAYVGDLGNHGEPVVRMEVARGGDRLVSISRDSLVKVWDFSSDGPARWLETDQAPAHTELNIGAPSADGSLLATVSSSGGVEIWSKEGDFIRYLPGPGKLGQYDVSISQAANLVAAAANDGVIRVWNVDGSVAGTEGRAFRELRGHRGIVNCVRFAPTGDVLASSGDDGKVFLWNAATGERLHELAGQGGRLNRVRFGDSGGVVLATSARHVNVWDARTGELLPPLPIGDADVFSLDVSPDGRTVAVGYRKRAIGLFDLPTRTHLADLTGHSELPWNLAFSPDGTMLLSCTAAGSLKFWDVASRVCLATFRDDGHGWIMPVAFIPGSTRVLVGHQFRGVSIWDTTFFDRHIRGNAQEQLRRLAADLGEETVGRAKDWVEKLSAVDSRPTPPR
ncbi:MAG: serine/threonine protein kinase [Phycisphaeraceae bacterium]|nr:serine/threonine protein kinase [Phycisphaeraceae bacterium]